MTEYWEATRIIGEKTEGEGKDKRVREYKEEVLHRRGEDPMVMAFRRNNELAGCQRIRMRTEEAFQEIRKEEKRETGPIPRESAGWEYEF